MKLDHPIPQTWTGWKAPTAHIVAQPGQHCRASTCTGYCNTLHCRLVCTRLIQLSPSFPSKPAGASKRICARSHLHISCTITMVVYPCCRPLPGKHITLGSTAGWTCTHVLFLRVEVCNPHPKQQVAGRSPCLAHGSSSAPRNRFSAPIVIAQLHQTPRPPTTTLLAILLLPLPRLIPDGSS